MQDKVYERDIVRGVKKLIKDRGGWFVRMMAGVGQRKGIPDIIACYKGLFLGIECKTPRGRVTDHQEGELRAIRLANGLGIIARSVRDVEDLLDFIDYIRELYMSGGEREDDPIFSGKICMGGTVEQGWYEYHTGRDQQKDGHRSGQS